MEQLKQYQFVEFHWMIFKEKKEKKKKEDKEKRQIQKKKSKEPGLSSFTRTITILWMMNVYHF